MYCKGIGSSATEMEPLLELKAEGFQQHLFVIRHANIKNPV